jgi:hypothetical protein
MSLEYRMCGTIRRSPPMKFRIVAPALAVALLALISSSAQAGLFSHHGYNGCGCEPACGAPAVACCDPAPSCCDRGCGHRGLFSCFKFRKPHWFGGRGGCCHAEPACGYEPACGAEAACGYDPGCGAEAACGYDPGCGAEAACGCAPSCNPCGRRHRGLLHGLFHHRNHGGGCGCAVEPACGYEPACGCN